MRAKALVLTHVLILVTVVCGCVSETRRWGRQREKWQHEERMAGIEARGQRMTEQEKAELAEMVADKVVERLKQQQK
jgi:hypothetical protein